MLLHATSPAGPGSQQRGVENRALHTERLGLEKEGFKELAYVTGDGGKGWQV